MKKNERCQRFDCKYFNPEGRVRYDAPRCNYSTITGHARTKDCTPEEALPCNCKFYISTGKIRTYIKKSATPQEWWGVAESMWKAGATLDDIAVATAHTPKTVKNILRLKGLLEVRQEPEIENINWETAFKLYRENYSDQKIADALGCKKWAVTEWRHKNKLESNYPGGKPKYAG